ncbi:hypothetical protein K432DRAFT_396746 [Lepidopterella palustris CBS 459.81]|uniref:CENP-V/GFA domain-containing protein n=1 Tax=Lepidopterella palustris CBS 459.81 TaxID=1314670 RepID=A0A8E2E2F6_9PEZI|nr:hypothetical protein K432DRAFT_396746 [Lepidopterella palustris CBS 459.81]
MENFTGQCACGAVKIQFDLPKADGIPKQALCHCIFCKRVTGACFTRSIVVPQSSISFPAAVPQLYVHSPSLKWHFCSACGGQLFSENAVLAGKAIVRVGTLDRQEEFEEVQLQLFCKRTNGWVKGALEAENGRFDEFAQPEVVA